MHHTYRLLNIDDYVLQDPHSQAGCSLPSGSLYPACIISLRSHICVLYAFLRFRLQRSLVKAKGRGHRGEDVTQNISLPSSPHAMLTVTLLLLPTKSWQIERRQYYLISIPTVDIHKKRPEESQDLNRKGQVKATEAV